MTDSSPSTQLMTCSDGSVGGIVGGEEIINMKDYISMDSPMAQALLNKEVGDEATVKTGAGTFIWRIKKIEYSK